ncbi:MAG: hypothetical protein MUF58_09985 [Arcicella sp.]|jgi:hypothetical protein|nr:hypothetical protein [Arcicella sp.]
MVIYWKEQAAYDEKGNFLAKIHQLPDTQFYGFLNYETEEIDFQQDKIKSDSFEETKLKIEALFKSINNVSEIDKILKNPKNEVLIPAQLLELFTEFSIHRP